MPEIVAELSPHPASPRGPVDQVSVTGRRDTRGLTMTYMIRGDLDGLIIGDGLGGFRTDGLWRSTCVELFIRRQNTQRYIELNFAPNGNWAAYQFEDYRAGGADLDRLSVQVDCEKHAESMTIEARLAGLPQALMDDPISIALCAVFEAQNGDRAYWALHHPLNKPDFHHIDSFKIDLD